LGIVDQTQPGCVVAVTVIVKGTPGKAVSEGVLVYEYVQFDCASAVKLRKTTKQNSCMIIIEAFFIIFLPIFTVINGICDFIIKQIAADQYTFTVFPMQLIAVKYSGSGV
jgi:hypothetical protein